MQGPVEQLLRKVVNDLDAIGATSYALIGGLAYSARIEPRYTRDIDFCFAVESENEAETITGALIREGYYPHYEIAHRITGKRATYRMRYRKPLGGLPVEESTFIDLLFSHSGIEHETVAEATPTEVVSGLTLLTARIPHLIAMKVLAESDDRLQDRIDLKNLIQSATDADLAEVPPLLDLITQRGFNNEKDLPAVYAGFLAKRQVLRRRLVAKATRPVGLVPRVRGAEPGRQLCQ